MKILVINPGSTSTKLAVYENEVRIWSANISHSIEELSVYKDVNEQFCFRKRLIVDTLKKNGIQMDFSAVIGRGGVLKPTTGGVYEICGRIIDDLKNSHLKHASNLAAPISLDIAAISGNGCKAYIADPAVTDELCDVARISGIPELPRISVLHALNSRAVARKHASETGRKYEKMNFIVVHMGGGISVSAHAYGRIVDVNNALNGEGPFSPERAGTLPASQLVDMCFGGKYSKDEIQKMICGRGGLYAHLGTTDVKKVVGDIEAGDMKSKLVLDSMIYSIAKYIGCMHIALKQKTDAIILTGGIAYSKYVIDGLKEWIEGLAPIVVIPGEDEMEALGMNALGALRGELPLQEYNPD